ncbi:hypothetical protein [Polyangium sorediatum]|uniref:STAS/SEC14 domain-containing protein n=1 Tax=Polyangium sorediatum TaxID=889274 RepID=A0ABT6P414_9BACT|nr:hypothetical protein [Polyangium sorediatum]MDI1435343.1 hypothetical protein [Polyangium sorediatum]
MQTRTTYGVSEMIIEPPDTVVIKPRGDYDGETATAMMEALITWAQARPFVLLLMDLTYVGALSPAARHALTSNGHRLPPRALAIHGGSFTVRVLSQMMDRASWLRGSRNRWVWHAPDEATARAWLDEKRKVLAAGVRPAER